MGDDVYFQPVHVPFQGRRGFRVIDTMSYWVLSEHESQDEAKWRCAQANRDPHEAFVVTDSTGKVL